MPIIKKDEKINALGINILVEMIEEEKETKGGIAIPSSSEERETCSVGKIISISDIGIFNSLVFLPLEVIILKTANLQIGDKVLLKKFDYTKIKNEEEKDLRLYNINGILAKVD